MKDVTSLMEINYKGVHKCTQQIDLYSIVHSPVSRALNTKQEPALSSVLIDNRNSSK